MKAINFQAITTYPFRITTLFIISNNYLLLTYYPLGNIRLHLNVFF